MICTMDHSRRKGNVIRLGFGLLLALSTWSASGPVAAYDWLQLGGNGQHSGNNLQETRISPANVATLARRFQVSLPGAADGAPAVLEHVLISGVMTDLLFVLTGDGHLVALNAGTGAVIWTKQHGPGGCHVNNGTMPCFTTSSPAVDPNRQYVYAYGLDGFVHKHAVTDGAEVTTGGWPELATLKGFDEKGSSALSIASTPSGTFLYMTNGGYPGDQGDYQGHVTAINLATGQQHVFNANCSNQPVHFVHSPGTPDCAAVQSAIWARPGVVYDPDTNKIYLATGNGAFDPAAHHWGDSIFALHPDGTGDGNGNPLDTYTPTNEQQLDNLDQDLGSTAPAILPTPAGCSVPHVGAQGGKDGKLRLVNLDNLSGQGGPGHLGGEIGPLITVGAMLATPAVWVDPTNTSTWLFAGTLTTMSGMRLSCPGGTPTLTSVWQLPRFVYGSSPLVANGVLFYIGLNTNNIGTLYAADPRTGTTLSSIVIGPIHWESPVVANGVLYVENQLGQLLAFEPPSLPVPRSTGSGSPPSGPVPPARPGGQPQGNPAPAPSPRT